MKTLAVAILSVLLASILVQEQATKTTTLLSIVQGGKQGFIDQTGKIVIPPKFDQVDGFAEGMARVKVGKLFGYIDETGKLVVPARFQAASDFSEGLARVMLGYKWGFIDKSGRMVIPATFATVSDFSDGTFAATIESAPQGKRQYRLVDRTGKLISPSKLSVTSTFSEGLALISDGEKDLKQGYVNKQWDVVIQPQYLSASPFRDGLAVVIIKGGTTLVIDKTGKTVISGYAVSPRGFSEGLISFVQFDDKSGQGLHGFLDKNGVVVIKPRFQFVKNFSEGLTPAEFNRKYGYIDPSGNFVIKPQFDNAESFSNGLAMVWVDGKRGYIDKAGNYIWKPTE